MRRKTPNNRRRTHLLAALIPLLLLSVLFWSQVHTGTDDAARDAVQPLGEQLLIAGDSAQNAQGTVRLPDLRGQSKDIAEDMLRGAGLVLDARSVPTDDPNLDGIVININPDGGTDVPAGTVIVFTFGEYIPTTATVLAGSIVRVPDVVGINSDDATDILTDADLVPDGRPVPTEDPSLDGIVIDVDPDGGTDVPAGTVIVFTFGDYTPTSVTSSAGDPPDSTATTRPPGGNTPTSTTQPPDGDTPEPSKVAVPDLIGMTKENAEQALVDVGLIPEALGRLLAAQSLEGIVDTQEDPAGTLLDLGTTAAFTYGIFSLPTGPATVAVPDLDGMTRADAEQAVRDAGLIPKATGRPVADPAQGDRVASQNPDAGTEVNRGSTVAFTYGIHTSALPPGINPPGDNSPGGNAGPTPGTTTTTTTPVPKVTVPDLIGSDTAAAEAAVRGVGLVPAGTSVAVDDPALDGTVIAQDPVAGAQATRGSAVAFTYGTYTATPPDPPATVSVPDLIGMTKADAEQALISLGLLPEALSRLLAAPSLHGIVDTQETPAGTQVSPGTPIAFTYGIHLPQPPGNPPSSVAVPDLIGMTKAAAEQALIDVGLLPEALGRLLAAPSLDGIVDTQETPAGTQVSPGTPIAFTYGIHLPQPPGNPPPDPPDPPSTPPTTTPTTTPPSTPPDPPDPPTTVAVPDLLGMTKDNAEQALTDVGLLPKATGQHVSDPAQDDKVASQKPDAGTQATRGSVVEFSYGIHAPTNPPSQVAVPDLIGMTKAAAEQALADVGLLPEALSRLLAAPSLHGIVDTQENPAGSLLAPGSTAAFTYGIHIPSLPPGNPPPPTTQPPGNPPPPTTQPPGTVTVPDLDGMTQADAEQAVIDAGLLPKATGQHVSDPAQDDKVASQKPDAGTQATRGSVVEFSYGIHAPTNPPSQVAVPDLIGMTKAAAEQALADVGLLPEALSRLLAAPSLHGIVDTQENPAGSLLAPGSTAAFTYGIHIPSLPPGNPPPPTTQPPGNPPPPTTQPPGTVTVPNLIGMTKADAEQALIDVGLLPEALSRLLAAQALHGIVDTQETPAGTLVDLGTPIAFTYGVYPGTPDTSTPSAPPTATTVPPAKVSVPDLLGMTEAQALQALSDVGLVADAKAGKTAEDPSQAGEVYQHQPGSGTQVSTGSTVIFHYYRHSSVTPPSATTTTAPPAQVAVPDLIGQAKTAAETAITGAGLVAAGTASTTADQSKDQTVFAQAPASGTMVDSGSTVSFDFYDYEAATGKVTVPDVLTLTTGFDKAEAEAAIRHVGLVPNAVSTTTHDQSEDGDVFSQTPLDGTELDAGETVTFNYYVYAPRPKVDVPKVSGAWNDPAAFELDAAKKKITDAGLVWEIVDFPRNDREDLDGWIGAQSPGATSVTGDQVEQGSTVTMTVHRYTGPVTVPNVVGETKAAAEQALRDVGLVPSALATFTPNNRPFGQVHDQQPDAGITASQGDTVTFYYWKRIGG